MKSNIISFIICTLLFIGCKSEISSTELKEYFTENQIKDLHKINNFFISEYLKSDKSNYKSALIKFLNYIKFNGKFSKNDELLFKKQLNLYKSISKSTFNQIWQLKITDKDSPFPNEKYISPNTNGKYIVLLKT